MTLFFFRCMRSEIPASPKAWVGDGHGAGPIIYRNDLVGRNPTCLRVAVICAGRSI